MKHEIDCLAGSGDGGLDRKEETNEGFIPGEVTSFPEFVRLPPVPGVGEHRIGSWALLAWLVIPFFLSWLMDR